MTTTTTTTTTTTRNTRRGYDNSSTSNLPLLACAFAASATTGGTVYAFGLYAEALKKFLQLQQRQVDSISTAFFLAGLFSWIPGLFVDRFGPKYAMVAGGFIGATMILWYWAVAKQLVYVSHHWIVWVLSSLGIFIFLSCGMITGAVFKLIVTSTGPGSKGSAVGAAKGYVGLGAGLYACLFAAVKSPVQSELDFLPMAAWFFLTCAVLPALCLLPNQYEMDQCSIIVDASTVWHFRSIYVSLTAMATLIIFTSMMDLYNSTNHNNIATTEQVDFVPQTTTSTPTDEPHYGRAFLLVAVWLAPIFSLPYLPRRDNQHSPSISHVPFQVVDDDDDNDVDDPPMPTELPSCTDDSWKEGNNITVTRSGEATNEMEDEGLLNESSANHNNRLAVGAVSPSNDDEPNLNLSQMLQTPSAWLMLWTTMVLVGAGTVVTNHMGQMVESLGFAKTVTPASLAFFSVAQAAARVATGSISEAAVPYAPRPWFLVLASVVGLLAHLILGFATTQVLFVTGVTLSGAAFGMVWPLLVLITGEVFGVDNVGANYMFYDGFTSAVGTWFMTKLIAQNVYESHISPHAQDPTTCLGMGCFQQTHLAVAGLSMTCIVTSCLMLITTKRAYKRKSRQS